MTIADGTPTRTETGLSLAADFTVPLDLVTETVAILGQRGSGKTSTAVVVVEEIVGAGHPAIVIDPLGVWWGLRSSADGKHDGLPVVIFGGDHSDVALTEQSGRVIAEAVVTERFAAIIDLSLLSKSASRRFMADFIETLYHRNREALHVVVDEADLFAPQRNLAPEAARLLGAMEDLVRRGRARGLGCTLITQRPAVLNKDVLSQASMLVAMRMTGKHDVAAIDEWVRLHADEEDARTLKGSLPSLPIGAAWFWSPGWLGVLEKVQVRRRTTFDSSATPKVGEARRLPKRMAEVDLDSIGAQIAAAAEISKANDPRALRAHVAQLERELAALRAAAPATSTVETVTEYVIDPKAVEAVADLEVRAAAALETAQSVVDQVSRIAVVLEQTELREPTRAASATSPAAVDAPKPRTSSAGAAGTPAAAPASLEDVHLKAGARRLLETLASQHPARLTKTQLATLAKLKVTGGTFSTYWGQIRRLGFVDERGSGRDAVFALTPAGFAYLGEDVPSAPMSGQEVIGSYAAVLKAGARQMLMAVVDAWPGQLTREDLATATDLAVTGGTFSAYLGTLRRNGLVDVGPDGVRLAEDLGQSLTASS